MILKDHFGSIFRNSSRITLMRSRWRCNVGRYVGNDGVLRHFRLCFLNFRWRLDRFRLGFLYLRNALCRFVVHSTCFYRFTLCKTNQNVRYWQSDQIQQLWDFTGFQRLLGGFWSVSVDPTTIIDKHLKKNSINWKLSTTKTTTIIIIINIDESQINWTATCNRWHWQRINLLTEHAKSHRLGGLTNLKESLRISENPASDTKEVECSQCGIQTGSDGETWPAELPCPMLTHFSPITVAVEEKEEEEEGGGAKKKHKHTRTSLHNKMKVMSYYGLGLVECGIHPIRRDSLRYFQIYPSIVIVLPLRSCLGSLRIVQDRWGGLIWGRLEVRAGGGFFHLRGFSRIRCNSFRFLSPFPPPSLNSVGLVGFRIV